MTSAFNSKYAATSTSADKQDTTNTEQSVIAVPDNGGSTEEEPSFNSREITDYKSEWQDSARPLFVPRNNTGDILSGTQGWGGSSVEFTSIIPTGLEDAAMEEAAQVMPPELTLTAEDLQNAYDTRTAAGQDPSSASGETMNILVSRYALMLALAEGQTDYVKIHNAFKESQDANGSIDIKKLPPEFQQYVQEASQLIPRLNKSGLGSALPIGIEFATDDRTKGSGDHAVWVDLMKDFVSTDYKKLHDQIPNIMFALDAGFVPVLQMPPKNSSVQFIDENPEVGSEEGVTEESVQKNTEQDQEEVQNNTTSQTFEENGDALISASPNLLPVLRGFEDGKIYGEKNHGFSTVPPSEQEWTKRFGTDISYSSDLVSALSEKRAKGAELVMKDAKTIDASGISNQQTKAGVESYKKLPPEKQIELYNALSIIDGDITARKNLGEAKDGYKQLFEQFEKQWEQEQKNGKTDKEIIISLDTPEREGVVIKVLAAELVAEIKGQTSGEFLFNKATVEKLKEFNARLGVSEWEDLDAAQAEKLVKTLRYVRLAAQPGDLTGKQLNELKPEGVNEGKLEVLVSEFGSNKDLGKMADMCAPAEFITVASEKIVQHLDRVK
jgi:hypothetical protein